MLLADAQNGVGPGLDRLAHLDFELYVELPSDLSHIGLLHYHTLETRSSGGLLGNYPVILASGKTLQFSGCIPIALNGGVNG
jgi:hypothetical protein